MELINVDTTEKLPTVLSLCSGYGGLELGLERALGEINVLAHVEIEAFAVANLVNKMETGAMVPAPIWTDLKTFNARIFRGVVDILTGGYPCQPFSAAGKRAGTDDPRHLWPYIRTIIMDCRPRTVFFENVEGHLSLGIFEVLADLEEMGYRVEAGIFSASEVGAPHQRKRVFILAESESEPSNGRIYRRIQKEKIRRESCYSEIGNSCPDELAESRSVAGETGSKRIGWEKRSNINRGSEGAELGNSSSDNKRRSSIPTMHREGFETRGPGGKELANSGSEEFNRIPQTEKRFCDREIRNSSFEKWPARPGQPQYEWEEPRIVDDSSNT